MTKQILAFGASSSKTSINKQLANYAAGLFENAATTLLDLNDFEMPIYSIDKENENGIPQLAHDFYGKIGASDLVVISFAEHNGAYSSSFKNILDWMSRINGKTFQEKPLLLLATSPGARGGSSVLEMANKRFPFQGAVVKGSFSLPSFNDNFYAELGITNEDLKKELHQLVDSIVF